MNLHHTNACHGLGAAYVNDFCILIKYIFINCIFIYYNYQAVISYDYNHSYLLYRHFVCHIILRPKSIIYIHFTYLMIRCNTFP